jgi:hypothetical protein
MRATARWKGVWLAGLAAVMGAAVFVAGASATTTVTIGQTLFVGAVL